MNLVFFLISITRFILHQVTFRSRDSLTISFSGALPSTFIVVSYANILTLAMIYYWANNLSMGEKLRDPELLLAKLYVIFNKTMENSRMQRMVYHICSGDRVELLIVQSSMRDSIFNEDILIPLR